jgi:hypothetical protein
MRPRKRRSRTASSSCASCREAPAPEPAAERIAEKREAWRKTWPASTDVPALLARAGMSAQALDGWFRDELKIEAYLADRYPQTGDPRRAERISTWINDLRRRAKPRREVDATSSSYSSMCRSTSLLQTKSRSTMVRLAAPSGPSSAVAASETAAASAPTSPGSTSQPFTPGNTLSGNPPARVAITGFPCAIASSVTSELPS